MKTEVWCTFYMGAYSLMFSKVFEFPFTPFIGLELYEESKGGHDLTVEIITKERQEARIQYIVATGQFYVEVRTMWPLGLSEEMVDFQLQNFTRFGWKREDTTNIEAFKLMLSRA